MLRSLIGAGTILLLIAITPSSTTARPMGIGHSPGIGHSVSAHPARAPLAAHPHSAIRASRGEGMKVRAMAGPRSASDAPNRPQAHARSPDSIPDRSRPSWASLHRPGDNPRASPDGYAGRLGHGARTFWPDAYRDIHGWALWPQGYGRRFWGLVFDDVFVGVFWPPSYAASDTTGRADRVAGKEPAALSPEFARICSDQALGLSGWSFDRIQQTVQPTAAQQSALDEFRNAATRAIEALRTACPAETPGTAVERLDAMANRIAAMLDSIGLVRPPLERFYGALSDEQKARFNKMVAQDRLGRQGDAMARSLALGDRAAASRGCGDEQVAGYRDRTIRHIERVVEPTAAQRAALDELRLASGKAAGLLQAACSRQTTLTPTGRLESVERRLAAMQRAVKVMTPSLAKFYDLLSAGQKARFNTMSTMTARNG
jgi:hypothetical protein